MAGIGVFIAWLGYSLAYYGVDQIRSGNNGLLSLMDPFKPFVEQPQDSSQGTGGAALPNATAATKQNPNGVAFVTRTKAPKGAPKGNYGVDQNGTVYVLKNGSWVIYSTPGQTAPLGAV